MKTAMQEFFSVIKEFNKELYNTMYNEGILETALEKEKEQIIEARDGREISSFTTGKDYYDLNFNHHTELKPNSYTNFTPDNANAVAEYNEGLKNFTPSDKAILLTPKGTLTIGEEYSSPSISFYKNNEVEDVVTIKYTKFMYKGEEVKDLQTIYDIIKSLTPIELPSDLKDFHKWIEDNEWYFNPISFNGVIQYRWVKEFWIGQETTDELYKIYIEEQISNQNK